LSQRNAQLVIAREYGYAGWQDLTAEVKKRLGQGLEWAAAQARRAIHDNDVERLQQLIAEYPALLSWRGEGDRGLLGAATSAYGDSFDPEREKNFTRRACAEFLIEAGAVVTPSVVDELIASRVRGLLHLFHTKGLLPQTLKFAAALGDLKAVRDHLAADGIDRTTLNQAFVVACRFRHDGVAGALLDRLIAIDPELGRQIDGSAGRPSFVRSFIEDGSIDLDRATALGPWKTLVMGQIRRAAHGDVAAFVAGLDRERWLLADAFVWFQADLLGVAALNGREDILAALLDSDPAILRRQPPPPSQAIEFAITYGNTQLMPLLTRVWPVPDDLPHAAGLGDLGRVQRWFDESGAPQLGDVHQHFPHTGVHVEVNDPWEATPIQKVLDTALAWAVINRHFAVADFLLQHGADINTRWNSHEPASILHHLVFEDDYDAMQFLIDRGIDMTIEDHRWNANARGWARHGKGDEKMAQWLEHAERQRQARQG
jgi:hypothetical protein